MWDLIVSYVSSNFDIVFFGIITLIVLGAAILDIRDKNYPPGPLGLPVFGYIPLLNSKAPYLTLCELAQQYGRVFSVYFGSVYAVIVADGKLMREALNQEEFNKRAPLLVNHGIMKGNGISGAEGEKWAEHRNFVMRVFRELGVAGSSHADSRKSVVETYIQQHVTDFVNDLKRSGSGGVDIAPAITNNVGLALTDMVLGKQYSKTDAEFKSIVETMDAASQVSSVSGAINYVPWIRNFSNAGNTLKAYKNGMERNHTVFQALLDKRMKTAGSSNNNIHSVLEAYAAELSRREGDEVGTFTTEQIQHVLSDLIGSGWETSITTLKWLYLYMAMYPDIQENIVNEIKQVVDRTGQVTLKHFDNLPYTQATIMEIWRHRSIIPLGVPRATQQDTKIGDHLIPKGSMIVPLLWAINHDTRLWEKPDIFCPERFLNEDGSFYRNENLYPFQCGNRACVGDNIGTSIVELFFANTVNQLKISLPKGYHYNIEDAPECGLTLVPTPYQLHVESRH